MIDHVLHFHIDIATANLVVATTTIISISQHPIPPIASTSTADCYPTILYPCCSSFHTTGAVREYDDYYHYPITIITV
jgi:hypothetical protein